jgi:hypothetical protein
MADLGDLEGDTAAMADDLGADLDQLLKLDSDQPLIGSGVAIVRRKLPTL